MDKDFWLGRWARGETGWHQTEVEPDLVRWFSGRPRKRVFVPLCGKSFDMKWLLDQGHEIVGCELSSDGCAAFFEENEIPVTISKSGEFQILRAPSITIFNGDIFALTAKDIGVLDAVYDRAAVIALKPELREKYVKHLLQILAPSLGNPGFEFLQILLERTPNDQNGPPFSVRPEDLERYYADTFRIELVDREKVDADGPNGSLVEQVVFLMKPRSA